MRHLPFVQLDVFTQTPFEGNQLAVFTDARGLSDAEMQRIARETNFSETTFILPREDKVEEREGVRARIFTTEEELPFAGHPTLGTAAVVRNYLNQNDVALQLNVGKIPVTFAADGFGEMHQNDPQFTEVHRPEDIAPIAGLNADDFRSDVPIQTVSTGLAFIITPVKGLEAISRLNFNAQRAKQYLAEHDGHFIYFMCTETMSPETQIHSRMIFYNGEDPATGSAAGNCISWCVEHGFIAPGKRVVIEQGIEIGRPSRLYVSANKQDGRVIGVRVGGYCVEVARGEYLLP